MATKAFTTSELPLHGFSKWFTFDECLKFAAHELGRLGLGNDQLEYHQWQLYRDLWSPFDEWALAQMLNYWTYDLEALRSRRGDDPDDAPPKPRIDVLIELTEKGNLRAEWHPTDWHEPGTLAVEDRSCDFKSW